MTTRAADAERGRIACTCHAKKLDGRADFSALSEFVAQQPCPAILGGNAAIAEAEGFSYWAAEPREVFEFTSNQQDPFGKLRRRLNKYEIRGIIPPDAPKGLLPCGWIGYFGYELGRYIERLPQSTVDDLEMPLIRLGFYDRMLAYDHNCETFWAVALEWPGGTESADSKIADLEQWLDASQSIQQVPLPAADVERIDFSQIVSNFNKGDYLGAIERVLRYIRDGDIYQVNLSQRFELPFSGRAIDLFRWQNRYNPSPYAAYLDIGSHQIVSASPEMFVTLRDGWVQTKPIKGTRPRRDGDHEGNAHNARELLTDEKERAELNMIVDLERNDIARVCRPGTRRVIQPRTIETYPTVFHAVATIGGHLQLNTGLVEVLKAVFPGGSITGAPKIRAMEIIDELEPTARGVYTGSIGWIGLDGTACLNIAIRTIIIARQTAFVQSGGGIVADSSPQAEWDETITKARALLAGIAAVQNL